MATNARTVLVTGGNRGIGLEVCRVLAEKGLRVWLGARNADKGTIAVSELKGEGLNVRSVVMDVADLSSLERAIEAISDPVDIVINNAAILDRGRLQMQDPADIDYIVRTNLAGPIILTRHFLKGMLKRRWGRVVNVTSGMGALSRGLGSESVVYRVTKLALNGLTLCLASEVEGQGVLINSVDPGWIRTEMGGPMARKSPREGAEGIIHAALLPDSGPNGKFFSNGRVVAW